VRLLCFVLAGLLCDYSSKVVKEYALCFFICVPGVSSRGQYSVMPWPSLALSCGNIEKSMVVFI
jgi:hypothetical protein